MNEHTLSQRIPEKKLFDQSIGNSSEQIDHAPSNSLDESFMIGISARVNPDFVNQVYDFLQTVDEILELEYEVNKRQLKLLCLYPYKSQESVYIVEQLNKMEGVHSAIITNLNAIQSNLSQ